MVSGVRVSGAMWRGGQELPWLSGFSGKHDICTSTCPGPLMEYPSDTCV